MDWKDYSAIGLIAFFFIAVVLTGLGIYFDSKQQEEDDQ